MKFVVFGGNQPVFKGFYENPGVKSFLPHAKTPDLYAYIQQRKCLTDKLFQILKDNMFNIKRPTYSNCPNYHVNLVYTGHYSYIDSVKWEDFLRDKEKYLETALDIREKIDDYDIKKTVKDT